MANNLCTSNGLSPLNPLQITILKTGMVGTALKYNLRLDDQPELLLAGGALWIAADKYTELKRLRKDREFKKMIHYSRHYGIDIITTSRRPANISRDLTSQTDVFSIFRITEKRDLDYFYALNAELPEMIKTLEPHHYIEYNHNSIEIKNPISLA